MFEIIICILAGVGAGLGTGLAGMSAAVVISPMLIVFLGISPYTAIGIALASDVLASAFSALTYAKNKNIDIKNGIPMMISVLIFTLIGSFVSKFVPSGTMGGFSTFMTLFLGLKFIIKPVNTTKEQMLAKDGKSKLYKSLIFGALVGFVCGFMGAGGGIMMLLILTSVLGYELKTAVGTSVFIMAFTALTGAVSHFVIGDNPDLLILITCMISTLIFALIGARFANKVEPKKLNRVTGIILSIIGVFIILFNYLG